MDALLTFLFSTSAIHPPLREEEDPRTPFHYQIRFTTLHILMDDLLKNEAIHVTTYDSYRESCVATYALCLVSTLEAFHDHPEQQEIGKLYLQTLFEQLRGPRLPDFPSISLLDSILDLFSSTSSSIPIQRKGRSFVLHHTFDLTEQIVFEDIQEYVKQAVIDHYQDSFLNLFSVGFFAFLLTLKRMNLPTEEAQVCIRRFMVQWWWDWHTSTVSKRDKYVDLAACEESPYSVDTILYF